MIAEICMLKCHLKLLKLESSLHSGERDVGGVSEMLLKIPIFNDILNVP